MKLFGHHVGRTFALFVALDGALFIMLLWLLSLGANCAGCGYHPPLSLQFHQSAALTGVFLLTTMSIGVYNNDATRDFRVFLKRFVLAAQFIILAAVAGLAFFYPTATSGWRIVEAIVALAALLLVLALLRLPLARGAGLAFLRKRIIVYGDGEMANAITAFIDGPGQSHFRLVQQIKTWRAQPLATTIGNLTLKQARLQLQLLPLHAVAEGVKAEEIVVAVEDRRGLPVEELLECRLRGIGVVDALTFWEREAGQIDFAHAGPGWLTFSGGFAFDQPHRVAKRLTDIIISLSFLIFVLPLCAFVALAIRLESPGPIFYRQERVGLNGRVFKVWKFRSMRSDAERDGVPQWANTTDDRVTRIGRFIRKVRLDEVPQVLNVLVGDMSFIGPRPERPFFVEQLREQIPHYDLRHRVRPGITGWAQVNYPYGASVDDARRKLAYDLYYLKKNDLLLDFAILVQTVRVILFAHGAR